MRYFLFRLTPSSLILSLILNHPLSLGFQIIQINSVILSYYFYRIFFTFFTQLTKGDDDESGMKPFIPSQLSLSQFGLNLRPDQMIKVPGTLINQPALKVDHSQAQIARELDTMLRSA
ncbi:MAG: hypothetical protein ACD_62C00338G0002, partial [uncultured bacterium]